MTKNTWNGKKKKARFRKKDNLKEISLGFFFVFAVLPHP